MTTTTGPLTSRLDRVRERAIHSPEKYEDLIVRVTGYSARFIELSPTMQEEIILRTEMNVCA